jgi:hypothetical protein
VELVLNEALVVPYLSSSPSSITGMLRSVLQMTSGWKTLCAQFTLTWAVLTM